MEATPLSTLPYQVDVFTHVPLLLSKVDELVWTSAIAALGSHALYNRKEPTVQQFFWFSGVLEAALLYYVLDVRPASGPVIAVLLANAVYWITLVTSIVVYRVFLHPLRRFPGPLLSQITRLHMAVINYKHETHIAIQKWHQQYGDIIRVGPNELSFAHADSVAGIHGAHSAKVTRGPWYDGNPGEEAKSLATTRDLSNHHWRRRVWEPAFSTKALKTYDYRLVRLLDIMVDQLHKRSGTIIDWGDWTDFFTFDVMGELGYGHDFGMLEKGTQHQYALYIHQSLRLLVFFSAIPWSATLWRWIPLSPQAKADTLEFWNFARTRFEQRIKEGSDRDDVFGYLLHADEDSGKTLSRPEIESDSRTIIIAGANSTALAMSFLFFFLLVDRKRFAKLREEVDSIWDGSSQLDGLTLGQDKAPYLNACINEALRVMPPGPNGMQRRVPDEGHFVAGVFVPPETQLSVHAWTMQRDERFFTKGTEFIPERWIDAERPAGFAHDSRAFIPFSVGNFGCVGKQLAMLEIRLMTTTVVKNFDFELDPQFDPQAFLDDCKSNLTLTKGPIPVKVTTRSY